MRTYLIIAIATTLIAGAGAGGWYIVKNQTTVAVMPVTAAAEPVKKDDEAIGDYKTYRHPNF